MGKISRVAALLLAAFLTTGTTADVTVTDADVKQVIKDIDELYRSTSSYSEIEMEIVTPHWQRTLAMNCWTQGMDKTFLRLTAPRKEKGVATLRIENEMWNYLPKTNKVIKVPPSMMMSSWMGSDFTNDDLVKEFSLFEDYTYELITVDSAREDLLYINCIPSEDLPIVWGNIVVAARKSDHLPIWQKYYDEKGKLMRVLQYKDIKTFGKRTLPAEMEMIPQTKEGHKTVIRYLKLDFDVKVDEQVFSLRNLHSAK
jgi:outer membrane lipoprotein-sorting protein